MFRAIKKVDDIVCFEKHFGIDEKGNLRNLLTDHFVSVFNIKKMIIQNDRLLLLDSLNKASWVHQDVIEKVFNHEFRVSSWSGDFLRFYKYGTSKANGIFSISKAQILFATNDYICLLYTSPSPRDA